MQRLIFAPAVGGRNISHIMFQHLRFLLRALLPSCKARKPSGAGGRFAVRPNVFVLRLGLCAVSRRWRTPAVGLALGWVFLRNLFSLYKRARNIHAHVGTLPAVGGQRAYTPPCCDRLPSGAGGRFAVRLNVFVLRLGLCAVSRRWRSPAVGLALGWVVFRHLFSLWLRNQPFTIMCYFLYRTSRTK